MEHILTSLCAVLVIMSLDSSLFKYNLSNIMCCWVGCEIHAQPQQWLYCILGSLVASNYSSCAEETHMKTSAFRVFWGAHSCLSTPSALTGHKHDEDLLLMLRMDLFKVITLHIANLVLRVQLSEVMAACFTGIHLNWADSDNEEGLQQNRDGSYCVHKLFDLSVF